LHRILEDPLFLNSESLAMETEFEKRKRARADARSIFLEAVRSVDAGRAVSELLHLERETLFLKDTALPLSRVRRCMALGAGKATAAMGRALESILGDRLDTGHIVVKYGHGHPLTTIRVTEAGHPIPDMQGVIGARAVLNLAQEAGPEDLVIVLLSGGGSALLPLPLEMISLDAKQNAVATLLECGASIHEMNTVRKHLSGIKGGRLAGAVHPARLIALILSDVVGDTLDIIASGPTVPDPSTFRDCMDVVERYKLENRFPPAVMTLLQNGVAGKIPESPKPGDPVFENTECRIIGNNSKALKSAQAAAEKRGYRTLILSSTFQGDTREAARFHGALADEILRTGNPVARPACLLSGGETTVVVSGSGTGGRNQEFVLQAAIGIAGSGPAVMLSAGTDGTDGPTDAAGALADDTTVSRAHAAGMDPHRYLNNNDAYPFFKALGDLVVTGPTDTNVMDLRIVLVP